MLVNQGVVSVYHYVPLHYLAFILRSSALMSKTELRANGHQESHFRSTSKKQDIGRGFDHYIHMSLEECPPILQAKLKAGFPHFEIMIPAFEIDAVEHHLCRFNIAKTRYFKGAKQQPDESSKNGRYYGDMALPIAVTDDERRLLLEKNLGEQMIEVLISDRLILPDNAVYGFFSQQDMDIANDIAGRLSADLDVVLIDRDVTYNRNENYSQRVSEFLENAMSEPNWKGNGLEFDNV